jgi:hypothetical protein
MVDDSGTPHVDAVNFLLTKSGWWLLAGFFVVLSAACGAAYKIGGDVANSANTNYSTVDKLKLDKLAEDTRTAAAELKQATSRFNQLVNADDSYKALRVQLDKREVEFVAISNEKLALETRIAELNKDLEAKKVELGKVILGSNSYAIPTGKAIMIADENIFTSVVSRYGYSKFIVAFNNDKKEVAPGDTFQIPGLKNPKCTIFIKEYNDLKGLLEVSAICAAT